MIKTTVRAANPMNITMGSLLLGNEKVCKFLSGYYLPPEPGCSDQKGWWPRSGGHTMCLASFIAKGVWATCEVSVLFHLFICLSLLDAGKKAWKRKMGLADKTRSEGTPRKKRNWNCTAMPCLQISHPQLFSGFLLLLHVQHILILWNSSWTVRN